MQKLRNTISKNLAKARKSRDYSQGDLAKRTGLMPSAIAHFEAGRRMPTVANLLKLADALGIKLDDLFGRTPFGIPMPLKRQHAASRKVAKRRGK